MQYRLTQVMVVTSLAAVMFALVRINPAALSLIFPLCGGWCGYRVARTAEGFVLGFFSSIFWSMMAIAPALLIGFLIASVVINGLPGLDPGAVFAAAAILYFGIVSWIGGHIGGRVAIA